jgi:hypothetical protein
LFQNGTERRSGESVELPKKAPPDAFCFSMPSKTPACTLLLQARSTTALSAAKLLLVNSSQQHCCPSQPQVVAKSDSRLLPPRLPTPSQAPSPSVSPTYDSRIDRSEVTLRPSEAGQRPKRSLPRPFPPYPRPFRSHLASPPKPLVTLPKSPATRAKSLFMSAKPLGVLSEAALRHSEVTRARPEATLRLSRSHPPPLRSHPR